MTWLWDTLLQAVRTVWAHKLRSALTMFGISWGVAAIIFMMAIGDGFKAGYRNMLYALGTDLVIVWGGRTSQQAGDQRAGREIRLRYADVLAIREQCAQVAHVTPELSRTLTVSSAHNAGSFSVQGVAPVYQQIRSMGLGEGRLLTEGDFRENRRLCVLGDQVRQQLFGRRSAVGAEVRLLGIPFTVVGQLKPKDQQNSYNGFDSEKILLPYTTMAQLFPDPRPFVGEGAIDNILFMPVSAAAHEEAVRQVRTVLGRRHGFAPTDRGALWMWDTVETAQMVNRVYDSMQRFLAFVAVVTLGLGGIGVMNIMLISVAERTREIGVKQALGAPPGRILMEFFVEAIALTVFSGLAGVGFALGVCWGVNQMPLPTLFAGLPVTPATAWLTFGLLGLVGVLSAVYPARRASRLTPVEALRYE